MKQMLQESALRHLLNVEEAKVDSLLPKAEPEVKAILLKEMTSQAARGKKFDRALPHFYMDEKIEAGQPHSKQTASLGNTHTMGLFTRDASTVNESQSVVKSHIGGAINLPFALMNPGPQRSNSRNLHTHLN
jgi:hypothetical protein